MSKETLYISTGDSIKTHRGNERDRLNKRISKLNKQKSLSFSESILVHNRCVFPRVTSKRIPGIVDDVFKSGKFKNFKDNLKSNRDNTTLNKDIRFCRLWWNYLRLCLELESKSITLKNSDEPIKVNRKKYREWNLDKLLSYKQSQFDLWFNEHKHLFVLQPIKLISKPEEMLTNNYIISIPRESTLTSVKREIEILLKEKLVGESTIFSFSERITPYITIHYEYNSLVLAFNNNTRNTIMNVCNDKYKNIKDIQKKKPNSDDYETENVIYSFESAVSRTLNNGKQRLYSVANGIFP